LSKKEKRRPIVCRHQQNNNNNNNNKNIYADLPVSSTVKHNIPSQHNVSSQQFYDRNSSFKSDVLFTVDCTRATVQSRRIVPPNGEYYLSGSIIASRHFRKAFISLKLTKNIFAK